MKSATIVAIVLGVLVVLSMVQAVQLNSLKSKVANGELSIGASTTTQAKSASAPTSGGHSGGGALPSSIQNLPTMVGGC